MIVLTVNRVSFAASLIFLTFGTRVSANKPIASVDRRMLF